MTLHVIGAGGHAKVIVSLADCLGFTDIRLYDDRNTSREVLGFPVVGGLSNLSDSVDTSAIIAIGANQVRRSVARQFQNVRWVSLLHPHAWLARGVTVGAGSVVMAGAVLQPGVHLGQHVIVNTAASIDHDCVLGDFVHVAPGSHLAGNVHLHEGVFGGVGSAYVPGSCVGAWSIVGAGAVVTKAIPANVTAVGAPAKVIKERHEGWHLS